ncbi:MAG: hypothetical protein IT384_00795 [Deltaproteobacteria bacterium]|nr:hypothetical protein [Deltaproteobacteria bacterium]
MRGWMTLLGALALSGHAAQAGGPPPPPGFGKAPAKAKAEPKPGDLIAGEVKLKLGDKPYRLAVIRGDILVQEGVFVVTATWRDSERTEDNFLAKEGQQFQLMFSTKGPGRLINGVQITMSYARDEQGVSKIVKQSTCAFTLTTINATEFAGKGSCTAGLLDAKGKEARPITDIEFSGRAK